MDFNPTPLDQLVGRCLVLDLELRGGRLAEGAGILKDRVARDLAGIEELAVEADFVVGHNLLDHDLAWLREAHPHLRLLQLPAVDTLWLSPLAFPAVPYHRLVKDYRLVRDSLPDPVQDCRLATQVLRDSLEALLEPRRRELSGWIRHCLRHEAGFGLFFEQLGIPETSSWSPGVQACASAWAEAGQADAAGAFVAAWLEVAGSGSVLPAWVRRRFPEVAERLHRLREVSCGQCTYCIETHDPKVQLGRWFGLDGFRGPQEPIVRAALDGKPLLALLPTGGGKSICYQLPALIRHGRRGTLTVVVSPLQALMKDQVDHLTSRTPAAAALTGMLTPPERGAVLERVRLGEVALLYVAPEQLRNRSFRKTLEQREIGAWVFDEAHCLSKWGHDFRPDYLYAGRFIRELAAAQGVTPPPVSAFTATAKPDVRDEIRSHFEAELGQRLEVFESGVDRPNLVFEVQRVRAAERRQRLHELLEEHLGHGSAVVYAGTRRSSEELAADLVQRGWEAAAFHAGLQPMQKREVQDGFLAGVIRVVCATNAFGMGIDKADVRLVVHAQMPGSLEAYLQEAGRAGRDGGLARCVLFHDDADAEVQFRLQASGEISKKDLEGLRRAIYDRRANPEGIVVATPRELLRQETVEMDLDPSDAMAETKIKAAVAWLERAGFLERLENDTRVFQGRLRVRSQEEAAERIAALRLSDTAARRWKGVLSVLFDAARDEPLGADQLAELSAMRPGPDETASPTQLAMHTLHQLTEAGLLERALLLTAYLRHKVSLPAQKALEQVTGLEAALLEVLEDEGPLDTGDILHLSLRRVNQRLLDLELPSQPHRLRSLLVSLTQDGRAFGAHKPLLELRAVHQDQYRLKLLRDWSALRETSERRRLAASAALGTILKAIPTEAEPSAALLVEFALEDLTARLRHVVEGGQQPAAAERSLMYLHENRVLLLQNGLAVFRQAMTLRRLAERRRRTTLADYEPLARHYDQRRLQIHVMDAYARMGLEDMPSAQALVQDYFTLAEPTFLRRHFRGRREELRRATTAQSWQRIVGDLGNADQEEIVTLGEQNALVLAGPGSGKTRVVVHRCAYLLRVLRVPASAVLVLCFNRAAATELRRRLDALVGQDARGVVVQTYHGLALRLTGTSLAVRAEGEGGEKSEAEEGLAESLRRATRLLRGDEPMADVDQDELRDRLLGGTRFILVDEYQDVDQDQYDLISALAGRGDEDPERKLTILAVGDDDQNVYGWRGANIEFIRRFREDYQARVFSLLQNYRSSRAIVEVAGAWIERNQDRMKRDQPIRVDRAREGDPPGLPVERIEAADAASQATAALAVLEGQAQQPGWSWEGCAVLARTHDELGPLRALCESRKIGVSVGLGRGKSPRLTRLRETCQLLEFLRGQQRRNLRVNEVLDWIEQHSPRAEGHPWWRLLAGLVEDWQVQTAFTSQPAAALIEDLYEGLAMLGREPRLGGGLWLGTLHAGKGLEFDRVALLVPGLRPGLDEPRLEEERRLLYVGMTRARRTLALVVRGDRPHPEVLGLAVRGKRPPDGLGVDAPSLVSRRWTEDVPRQGLGRRFEVLGPADLYLSFAGKQPASEAIHRRLSRLAPGSRLWMTQRGEGLSLESTEGEVARLSSKAAARWMPELGCIEEVRVLGTFVRRTEDSQEAHRESLRVPRWLVPWVEVVLRT